MRSTASAATAERNSRPAITTWLPLAITVLPLTISNGDAYRSVLGLNDLCRAIDKIIEVDVIKNKIYNLTSISDKIINFGYEVKRLTDSELIVNDSFKTDYSFNCSAELFEKDYNFKFGDTIESIYNDIIINYDNILFNTKRGKITYE